MPQYRLRCKDCMFEWTALIGGSPDPDAIRRYVSTLSRCPSSTHWNTNGLDLDIRILQEVTE